MLEHLCDAGCVHADDRSHPPPFGLSHERSPLLDQSQPRREIEDLGGKQGAILTQTVTKYVPGANSCCLNALQIGESIYHEESGLRIFRLDDDATGVFEAKLANRIAQNLIGLPGEIREGIKQPLSHPHGLRSLPRKHEPVGLIHRQPGFQDRFRRDGGCLLRAHIGQVEVAMKSFEVDHRASVEQQHRFRPRHLNTRVLCNHHARANGIGGIPRGHFILGLLTICCLCTHLLSALSCRAAGG